MTGPDVLALLDRLNAAGIAVWLDGGWAVDAMLEDQTRVHEDVDIVIEGRHLTALRRLLHDDGYRDVPRDDTCAENFVLGDTKGHLVDVHVVDFDAEGRGIYGPLENGVFFPAHAFEQPGQIEGRPVRCITARYQVEHHATFVPRPKDIADMQKLCARFGLALPSGYPAAD